MANVDTGGGKSTKNIVSTDTALEKLEKLLPAQATAAFLAIKSFIDVLSASSNYGPEILSWVSIVVIIIITAITPYAAKYLLEISNRGQIFLLTTTFFIWAINIDYGRILTFSPLAPISSIVGLIVPILLLLWAILLLPLGLAVIGKKST